MNIVKELIELKNLYNKLLCKFGNILTVEQDPTVPFHVKNITQEDINNWNTVEEVEVQITETTNFAEVGQNQKDFNKNVSDYKISADLKNQEQDDRLTAIEGDNTTQYDLINDLNSELDSERARNDAQDSRLENLEGINYTWSPTNRVLTLYDNNGTQLSQVSLVSLDNEGTDIKYNASTLSLELYNADNELLDSIPVSSFIGSVGTQLQLNSNQLQLKDSQGNILSTVSFSIVNIPGLLSALDSKLNKGSFPGNASDLKTEIDGKLNKPTLITDGNVPRWNSSVENFVAGTISNTQDGNIGVAKPNPTERLDVNGNVKSDSYKFTLPSALTPQPNMLIPKTDGSGLMWYNNSSVGAEIPSYSSPISGYVARWDGTKFVNGSIQDNGSKVGIGGAPSTTSPLKVYNSNQIFLEIPHSTNPIPTNVGYGQFFTAYGRLYARQSNQHEYGNDGGNANGYGNSADLLKVFGLVPDMIFGNVPLNLNTIHTSNRAKYGASMLFCDGPYSGNLVSVNQPTAVGYHPDMIAGWTFSMIPTSQAGVQFRIDGNGQLYARGTGGQYHAVTPWKKYIGEVQNTTTTLVEKLALARVKLKSYTKSERDALSNKEVGEMIWQTDSGNSGIRVYDGTNWLALQTTID